MAMSIGLLLFVQARNLFSNAHRQGRATKPVLKGESRELYRVAKDDLRLLRPYPHSYVPARAIFFAAALHNSASQPHRNELPAPPPDRRLTLPLVGREFSSR